MIKRSILIFTSILTVVYGILTFLDRGGEYQVEQMIWKANEKFHEIARDPAAVPDQSFDQLSRQYQKIIEKFPKSPLAKKAYLAIGRLYLVQKDFPKTRLVMEKVLQRYPDDQDFSAECLTVIGKSYELAGDPVNAVKVYTGIMTQYPVTDIGLSTPLYIANYYKSINQNNKFMSAYNSAISHYKTLSAKYPNSSTDLKSLRLLANCYIEMKMWNEAVETFGQILISYPSKADLTPQRANLILKSINTISTIQLKNYDIPIRIYQNFIDQHPQHGLNKVLHEMIKSFNLLRIKGVEVDTKNAG